MAVLDFVKNYWTIIMFVASVLSICFHYMLNMKEATKCSLRNDMLTIYDSCKKDKQITKYQLQAFTYSYEAYKKLKGNSFIDEIYSIIKMFELID